MIFRTIDIDFTVISGTKDVKVYVDQDCAVELPGPIHFGDIPQGESRDIPLWLKNEGLIPTDVIFDLIGGTPGAIITAEPNLFDTPVNTQPGEVLPVTVTITVAPDAALADYAFQIEIGDGIV